MRTLVGRTARVAAVLTVGLGLFAGWTAALGAGARASRGGPLSGPTASPLWLILWAAGPVLAVAVVTASRRGGAA